MSDVPSRATWMELAQFDTGTLSDALDALGLPPGVPGLRPLWRCPRICGPAETVELVEAGSLEPPPPGSPPEPKRHLGAAAVDASQPGSVIVVASDGRLEPGAWGGMLSLAASAKGVAGAVIDGACRDLEEAEQLGFPVFARGTTPRTARTRVVERASGGEITVCGTQVRRGDIVVADATGVVFMAAPRVGDVLAQAKRIAFREAEMAARLRAGQSASSVMGANYEDLLGSRGEHDGRRDDTSESPGR